MATSLLSPKDPGSTLFSLVWLSVGRLSLACMHLRPFLCSGFLGLRVLLWFSTSPVKAMAKTH